MARDRKKEEPKKGPAPRAQKPPAPAPGPAAAAVHEPEKPKTYTRLKGLAWTWKDPQPSAQEAARRLAKAILVMTRIDLKPPQQIFRVPLKQIPFHDKGKDPKGFMDVPGLPRKDWCEFAGPDTIELTFNTMERLA